MKYEILQVVKISNKEGDETINLITSSGDIVGNIEKIEITQQWGEIKLPKIVVTFMGAGMLNNIKDINQ